MRFIIQSGLLFFFVFFSIGVSANTIADIGSVVQTLLPITAAGISVGKKDFVGLKQFAWDFGSTLVVVYSLKEVVPSHRPDGGSYSFPSGHTADAFSASIFLWRRYGYRYGIPTTILACFVGVSRITARRHHWYDVLAGAGIGTVAGFLFVKPLHLIVSPHVIALGYSKLLVL